MSMQYRVYRKIGQSWWRLWRAYYSAEQAEISAGQAFGMGLADTEVIVTECDGTAPLTKARTVEELPGKILSRRKGNE